MRVRELFQMGKEYLVLGIVLVFLVFVIAVLFRKFIWKKQEKISWKKWMGNGILLCYLVVVLGVTLLDRGTFLGTGKIQPLFYSYRDAWVNFSETAWRNIILNICMFVPFGILLPCCVKRCRKWWKVYLSGFLFTLFIEGIQLVTERGIFELDDLLGNTAGAMIGYGIFAMLSFLYHKKKKSRITGWKEVVLLQVPLLVVVFGFTSVFTIYHRQELGNLSGQCLIPYDTKKLEVISKIELSEERKEAPVYRSKTLTKKEIIQLANDIFATLGTSVYEEQNDFYENTAILKAGERFSLWLDYQGGTYQLTDFETSFSEEQLNIKKDASEEELRKAFASYGTPISEESVLSWDEDTEEYCFTVDRKFNDTQWEKGEIRGKYYENGCFSEVQNMVVTYELYKDFPIISEEEAYKKLEEGEFRYWGEEKLNMEVLDCNLEYQMDSKGFYQPVYLFNVLVNENEEQIVIAAIE